MLVEIRNEEIGMAFESWVDSRKSIQTKIKYRNITAMFVQMVFNKAVEELNEDDFSHLKYSVVYDRFVKPLKTNTDQKKAIKDSTISNYLTIISSFFDYIDREEVFPNTNFRKIREKYLSVDNLAKDKEHINPMSMSDFDMFKEWLINRSYPRTKDGNIGNKYAMLSEFMFVTAIRVSAAFKLKWTDFEDYRSMYDNRSVKISVKDKGSKINTKFISVEFYENLRETMYEEDGSQLVFGNLNKRTFASLTEKWSQETGRKITPHSIKVGAGTNLYARTKDIVKTQRFLDHEDINTTTAYIRDSGNPEDSGSFILSTQYDYDELEKLSKEQLLNLIKQHEDICYTVFSDAKKQMVIK